MTVFHHWDRLATLLSQSLLLGTPEEVILKKLLFLASLLSYTTLGASTKKWVFYKNAIYFKRANITILRKVGGGTI